MLLRTDLSPSNSTGKQRSWFPFTPTSPTHRCYCLKPCWCKQVNVKQAYASVCVGCFFLNTEVIIPKRLILEGPLLHCRGCAFPLRFKMKVSLLFWINQQLACPVITEKQRLSVSVVNSQSSSAKDKSLTLQKRKILVFFFLPRCETIAISPHLSSFLSSLVQKKLLLLHHTDFSTDVLLPPFLCRGLTLVCCWKVLTPAAAL